jgi:hypothetical protein
MAVKSALELMLPGLLKGLGLDPESTVATMRNIAETVGNFDKKLDEIRANQILILDILSRHTPEENHGGHGKESGSAEKVAG